MREQERYTTHYFFEEEAQTRVWEKIYVTTTWHNQETHEVSHRKHEDRWRVDDTV